MKTQYHRPKTRGELRNKLLEGVECEVVSDNIDFTTCMLEGWLGMGRNLYGHRESENKGWTVFYPKRSAAAGEKPAPATNEKERL